MPAAAVLRSVAVMAAAAAVAVSVALLAIWTVKVLVSVVGQEADTSALRQVPFVVHQPNLAPDHLS